MTKSCHGMGLLTVSRGCRPIHGFAHAKDIQVSTRSHLGLEDTFHGVAQYRRKMGCPSSERSPLVQMILKYVQAVTLVWMEVKVDS